MKIRVIEKDDTYLRLLIEGTSTAFMNTLRRIIVSEVPTMAIDEVVIIENTSTLQDEFLSHRIGLLPLETDLETYNLPEECTCGSEFGCNLCRVSLALEAEAEGHTMTVYSRDFKPENPSIRPVSRKVPIVKLTSNQRIQLEAYARLGKGKDHARWQPTSMCAYKNLPKVTVNRKLCNLCNECAKVCPKGILAKTADEIQVRNILDCSLCKDCVDACKENPKAITVTWDENSFILNVESTGALSTDQIVEEALNILSRKLKAFREGLKVEKIEI